MSRSRIVAIVPVFEALLTSISLVVAGLERSVLVEQTPVAKQCCYSLAPAAAAPVVRAFAARQAK